MSSAIGHLQISIACLIYLCTDDFLGRALTPDCIAQYPLARFAAQFWHHHCGQPDIDMMAELGTWIHTLLSVERNFDPWIRLYDVDNAQIIRIYYNNEAKRHASPIYYAALLGFDNVWSSFLSCLRADVNAQGGSYGNALQATSVGVHEKVVRMLLDGGADVNAQGGEYGNVLQAASLGSHEKVVQILLDCGADINAQGGRYGNALQAASWRGHEKMVQKLLDGGADVHAQGGHYGNALQAASWRGQKKVVQMLVDSGAEVNAQGGVYGNALQAASSNRHKKVVQMLLAAGAEDGKRNSESSNASSSYFFEVNAMLEQDT